MPSPFDLWTYAEAAKAVKAASPAEIAVNRLFYEGEHWQEGAGWIGPMPQLGEAGYQQTMAALRRGFTSKNVIKEVVDRHVGGVLGLEPVFGLTLLDPPEPDEEGNPGEPSADDAALIAEAEAALTAWWDARKIHAALKDAAASALYASRGPLRMYVPRGKLDVTVTVDDAGDARPVTVVRAGSLAEALDKLYVGHPIPESSVVYEDPDTKARVGVFLFQRVPDGTAPGAENPPTEKWAELVFLDDQGRTVMRQVREGQTAAQALTFTLDLGGLLTLEEVDRDPLITEQVRQGQKALNLALSMIPRNVTTGGFLEQVLLNAQMPGRWEQDEAGKPTRFVPEPYQRGPGTVAFLTGVKTQDATGKETITTPSVEWRDPVPVDSSVDAKFAHYADILEEVDQGHVLLASEAAPSGRSREQARGDYEASLRMTAEPLEVIGRWVIEGALAMAEQFMGAAGRYTKKLRATFECRIHLGPVSPDERRAAAEEMKANLVSQETAMARVGVVDVGAELERMRREETGRLEVSKRRAEVVKLWTDAGAGIREAMLAAGIPEEEIAVIFPEAAPDNDGANPVEQ